MSKSAVDPVQVVEQGVTETEPLLHSTSRNLQSHDKPQDHSRTYLKIYVSIFFVNLGSHILSPAQTQIYENIYCTQWYGQHPVVGIPVSGQIPESYCKIAPVQIQISSLKGWLEFFNATPGLLLSIPMGMLTDAIGRRYLLLGNVTVLCLTQVWIAFVTWFGGDIPLRAVWLGASMNLLTGGSIVLDLLLVCVLTDISPSEQLANIFFRATAFGNVSRVVGPLLAATLMHINPWLAIYCGLTLLVATIILVATLPETLPMRTREERRDGDNPTSGAGHPRPRSRQSMRQVLKIWSDWRLVFVALTYPFRTICSALSDLIQRYVSDRYGWSLADATLVYTIQAAAAALMTFTVLPFVSTQIDRQYSLSIIQKNVVMSRASLCILFLAYALIGLAPTSPIMIVGLLVETLSSGFLSTMRALASALVDSDDKGRVFSVLAITETLGFMMGYPLSAALFNIGIEKGGGPWLGLPYDLVSVAALLGCIMMCLLRFERRGRA